MYRGDVEGLRALAVLSIVLFHFDVFVLSGGFIGVDIFFVISGYVISRGIESRIAKSTIQYSFIDFYMRRVRRILPALIVTIVGVLLSGFILFSVNAYRDLNISALMATFSLSNFYFMNTTGYFDASAVEKPLLHMWSLSVEEQFYLIWPLCWVFVCRRFDDRYKLIILGCGIAIFLLLSEVWVRHDRSEAFFMMPARFFEFLLGAMVVVSERKLRIKHVIANSALFILGLSVTVFALFNYEEKMNFPGLAAFFPAVATAVLIYSGSYTPLTLLFSNRLMRFFGSISYSLYLVHWPLLVFYKYVYGYTLSWAGIAFLCAMSCALAYLMWRGVEQPFRKKIGGIFSLNTKLVAKVTLASLAGISAFTVYAYSADGLTYRLSKQNQDLQESYRIGRFQHNYCPSKKDLPSGFSCHFGDVKQKTAKVALIGDSHAANFRSGLHADLKALGLKGVHRGLAGCIPILTGSIIHEKSPKFFHSCRGRMENTFRYVMDNDDIEVVILAGRWSLYTRNTRLGENGSRGNVYLGESPDDEQSSERSKQVFRNSMDATIKALHERGKKIIIFGQVPNIGFDVKRCLFSPDFHGIQFAGCQVQSVAEAQENLSFTNTVLKNIADKHSDVFFIDSSTAFCERECIYEKEGLPLYSDSNHLIYGGSKLVVKKYSSQIAQFILGK